MVSGLQERGMPEIQVSKKTGYVSLVASEHRAYTIATTSPGATTTIYVGKHGKDLYISWRTFIRPVINQGVVIILLFASVVLGLITGGIQQSGGGLFGGQSRTYFSMTGFLFYTVIFLLLAILIVAIAGRIWKGNFLAFFFIEPNVFDADDITAMSLSAHKSLIRALDNAGIDVTKLRLKQNFKGGRRGEDL